MLIEKWRNFQGKISITVIPGPTALIAGLSLSGLPAHNFIFEGFLPVKPGARRKKLSELKSEKRTIIFYESPHRLVKALKDIEEILGNPAVTLARELTKKFEEAKKAPASDLAEYFSKNKPRGEFVVLINLIDKTL